MWLLDNLVRKIFCSNEKTCLWSSKTNTCSPFMDKEWRDKVIEHNKFELLSTFSISSEDEPTQQMSVKANSDVV